MKRTAIALTGCVLLAACSQGAPETGTLPASGVTSSNGGGQRATGGLIDTGVTNGSATMAPMSTSPRVPRY